MVDALAVAIIAVSLVVAAWAFVGAARDRPMDTIGLAGLAAVEVLVLAQIVVAVVRLVDGTRPSSVPTFVGYLVAAAATPAAAAVLAWYERTRYGSVIVGAAGLVVPVLVLRLQQVWGG